jgi:hypothetical protein
MAGSYGGGLITYHPCMELAISFMTHQIWDSHEIGGVDKIMD